MRYNLIMGDKNMRKSQTYNPEMGDDINRSNMALVCGLYLGIKDVSPSLQKIAAPVSEIAFANENGERIGYRDEIVDAIPWNERSLKTFGVVYSYEATASFIGKDGKTYIVPNDKPVIDHLRECGYVIAPYGRCLDGTDNEDSLILKEDGFVVIDINLPEKIVKKIDEMENGRPYYVGCQSYIDAIRFGSSFGLYAASEEEIQQLSLSERKLANIKVYGRVRVSCDLEEYVNRVMQEYYLNDKNFIDENCSTPQ